MIGTHRAPWSAEETARMHAEFAHVPTAQLAAALGRTYPAVASRARLLGLHKSDAYMASAAACRMDGTRRCQGQFKPGHATWNKGLTGSCGNHPNTQAHHFKSGQLSGAAARNALPVGSMRINSEGILQRKVSAAHGGQHLRWHPVHRMVWEAVNGPVPDGKIAVFRPGQRTTELAKITLDAVEVITRAENMRRNGLYAIYPPEVARVTQLRGALTRQINIKYKQGHSIP